ncbi:Sec7 domain containing protein [Tritrichomonas foetus]|uniref:Sec7 domain containing protein n=1 Tax=Tritrichomonas foetus TaxID=1144522 RepID=A0A1J4JU48_9EUKA|nr:Sec7 domain containing protein [Tritrichomonas foetus]|eukprot:OHT00781.1 Sec7 domain containing protein [Tritrichomonas foetus]
MSQQSAGAFIPLIHSQLAELKKLCGSLFHRPVRDAVSNAEQFLQNVKPNDKLDLQTALAPFFTAIDDDHKLFQPTVLDCFYKIFRQSSSELFPSRDLTCHIINVLIKLDKCNSDELNLTCCNVCIACLRSPSGIHFCHGSLLRKMFRLLFRIYNNCENSNTFNSIQTSINETLLALFDSYTKPVSLVPAPSIEEFSELATSIIFENSLSIRKYLGPILEVGDYSPTIRDVDVFGVISLLSRIIELNKLKLRTIKLATNFLIFALQRDSKFFERSAFRLLLETKIHVACLSLTLDNRIELAEPTAELFVTIWKRFAPLYTEGLNAVLVKGLQTTLTSPDHLVLIRSLTIYQKLAKYPQLFVDAFVNYDCDRSGFFDNVWENTLNLIVKLAYPDINKKSAVQVLAIEVVDDFLGALWDYYSNTKENESKATQEEAPQEFFQAKKTKDVFSKGLLLFKKSFKKGINFFIEHGFCENTPQSVADFLWNNPALDPGEVGQLIGDKDRVETLKCFTNHFDFRNLTFEQAFRQFLQKFQVPGEAQMIDRVMEQFGSKFYNDNPTLFSCADTVYVLAFSALMLHTDAFHPNVKARMTLEQFLINNKGIDNGADMPVEFLTELYKGITSKQIYVANTKTGSAPANSSLLTREQRADLYKNQCQMTLNEARNRSTNSSSSSNRIFHRSESPLFIGPMFQSIWGGALAVLTMTFEKSDDPKIYQRCLSGLSNSVHIASHCFIESALDTLVDSFGTFTCLRKGLREAKQKNIECTNALLKIALEDKNFLRGAWEIVMGELSALDQMQVLSQNFNVDDMKQLFASTPELDRESIVDFIRAVCTTSNAELNENPPRFFLLEQVRIVAVFNMERPRYIWLPIWDIIGDYLRNISCSQDMNLSLMGVNTLTQIAKAFLDQPELTQFHFQRHFMLPFQQVFEKQVSNDVRDYVLENLLKIVNDSGDKLQSGWSVIFELLTIASIDGLSQERAFQVVTVLVKKYLGIISSVDLISVLSSFIAKSEKVSIREEAVGYLGDVAKILPITEENAWFIIFEALGQSGQNEVDSVRVQSHNVFISIMKTIDLPSSYLKNAIEGALPQYFEATDFNPHDKSFFSSNIRFLNRLFEEIFDKEWPKYKDFENAIYECLVKSALSISKELSKATLTIIQHEYIIKENNDNIQENDQNTDGKVNPEKTDNTVHKVNKGISIDILVDSLTKIAENVDKLSIRNARYFLSIIELFNEATKHEPRFLDVIKTAIRVCEEKKLFVIWAQSRSSLLKAMQKFSNEIANDIAKCLSLTLSIYVENDFLKKNESDESLAWNQSVVVSLQMLNNMKKELFALCFEESADFLLTIIRAYSSEVRKQVSMAMQRKLL